jgi:hypothetical protein
MLNIKMRLSSKDALLINHDFGIISDMKDRVIQIKRVSQNSPSEDVAYWMSKSPEERFSAVEFLRRQWYETPPRLQRVFKIVQREGC